MDRRRLTSGAALLHYTELESTSLEARRQIADGTAEACWIYADRQTAGYGRRGRGWSQRSGDLAATWMKPLRGGLAEKPALIGFALSLALHDVLTALGVPADKAVLKWPNDVLLDGGKLSGILLERHEHDGTAWLAAGIGVNITSRPELDEYPTSRIADHVADAVTPLIVLDRLDRTFQHHLTALEMQGFPPLRKAWLDRAGGLNEPIHVRLPHETLHGIFEGIDENGALLLRTGDTIARIDTGDVFFGSGYASNGE